MANILLKNFEQVYSLESFLTEINCKMNSQEDKDRLSLVLHKLSTIFIAFDFNFKGPYFSIIDKRYTYEQIILLCCVKLKESNLFCHQNHVFLTNINQFNSNLKSINLSQLNSNNLEEILLATGNMSICYFMSKNDEGYYWRQLYSLIGNSIFKYLMLYSYIFRSINTNLKSYIQICGCRLNVNYKILTEKRLEKAASKLPTETVETIQPITKEMKYLINVFNKREEHLNNESNQKKTIEYQLKILGHSILMKNKILYSRDLKTKISKKFIFNDPKLELCQETSYKIINGFIFREVNFETCAQQEINQMKQKLSEVLVLFMEKYRKLPLKIFINCYCRFGKLSEQESVEKDDLLKKCVPKNDVYCFLRRCLMFVLDFEEKIEKDDKSCPLLGGKVNFEKFVKHLKKIISSLKHDKITLNTFTHGIKFARIRWLQPIKCHRLKSFIFLAFVRWLIEIFTLNFLRAVFFATETSKTNSEIFFFLKSDWKNILKSQLNDQATKNYKYLYHLEKIKEINAVEYCSKQESTGISMGRLLPKNVNNECRVISGSRAFNPYRKQMVQANFKFITLNKCLKWLISNEPSLIGFSCSGVNDIKNKYMNFLKLNSLNRCSFDLKQWHFMKSDIEKCYDSIDIDELIDYLDELFDKYLGESHVFSVVRYCIVQWDLDMKHLKIKYDYLAVRHTVHTKIFRYGSDDMREAIDKENLHRQGIFIPLAIHDQNWGLKKVKESLRLCLKHVLIQIHDELFERTNGILQGSICSRNLCDLYFGRIEKILFVYQEQATENDPRMKLNRANDLIMRMVDDYLIICSDQIRMLKIHNLIKKSFDLNEKKTEVHFWTAPNEQSMCLRNGMNFFGKYSNQFFSWCGFDFDVNTLDVYFNYDKYFDLKSMRKRLNTSNDYRFAYETFSLKFLRLFSLNFNSIIFENRINSFQAVLRNLVNCFGLSCIRFFIFSFYKLMPQQLVSNKSLQIKLIQNLCFWLEKNLTHHMRQELSEYFHSSLGLFQYLCFSTYLIILENKNQKALTKLLNGKLKSLKFLDCIKLKNAKTALDQIDCLIKQQTLKFVKFK